MTQNNTTTRQHPTSWPLWHVLLVGSIAILGLALRIFPGADHTSWIYDQARDAYVARSILEDGNLVINGPQTDYPGLNHGPLIYYVLAPFYFISHGDPNLPMLAMILINLSSLLPFYILLQGIFKNRRVAMLGLFVFALSYEQVEYARWIFNFSLSIPTLLWTYYFLWKSYDRFTVFTQLNPWTAVLAGFFLGLAIQGELFLLYLIPFALFFLYVSKNAGKIPMFLIGGMFGTAPLLLAEVKFGFLGTRTFIKDFLGSHSQDALLSSEVVPKYIDHLSVTAKHTLGGISYPMAFVFLVILIGYCIYCVSNLTTVAVKKQKYGLIALLVLFFSHSVLFTFHFPDQVFLNVGLALPMLALFAYACVDIWDRHARALSLLLILGFSFFSISQLLTNTRTQNPFDGYHMIQTGMLFSQKMKMVDAMYQMAGKNEQFSISVIGVPYGVRTVWASVFEQYVRRHGGLPPVWVGYKAEGYPADDFFETSDHPSDTHFLIIESNQDLLPPGIGQAEVDRQNEATTGISQLKMYGYVIEKRERKGEGKMEDG